MAELGLAGKVAVVTGAGSRGEGIGNGRAAAILLAREGAHVALLDAMPDWAEATRAMIAAEGGSAMWSRRMSPMPPPAPRRWRRRLRAGAGWTCW